MPPLDEKAIVERLDQLLAVGREKGTTSSVSEALHGTVTLLAAVYGPQSQQEQTLNQRVKAAMDKESGNVYAKYTLGVWPVVEGTLEAMKGDLKAGLVGSLRRRTIGEVVSDMLGLAKEALSEGTEGSKKVAAVLAAAAYEDTIRRMGESFANVQARPPLQDVVTQLKNATVIQGSEVGIVQSHLSFRNSALHAHWDKVTDTATSSCINLVEALLLKHFS